MNTVWSAEVRRGGLLARQPRHRVRVSIRAVHPARLTCAEGSQENRRKDRGESLVMRARYIRTRAYIYERYEGPPRARASIWPVLRSTVIVAPDNVSGFVPPMDLPSLPMRYFIRRITALRNKRLRVLVSIECTQRFFFCFSKVKSFFEILKEILGEIYIGYSIFYKLLLKIPNFTANKSAYNSNY